MVKGDAAIDGELIAIGKYGVPPMFSSPNAQLPGSVDGGQIAERCREQNPG
jgi:hypothetical protein